jgi:hypothetical protein
MLTSLFAQLLAVFLSVQVAHGLALHRLEALEGLASSGAATTAAGADSAGAVDEQQQQAGGVLAVAGSLKKLQVSSCSPCCRTASPVCATPHGRACLGKQQDFHTQSLITLLA